MSKVSDFEGKPLSLTISASWAGIAQRTSRSGKACGFVMVFELAQATPEAPQFIRFGRPTEAMNLRFDTSTVGTEIIMTASDGGPQSFNSELRPIYGINTVASSSCQYAVCQKQEVFQCQRCRLATHPYRPIRRCVFNPSQQ